MFIKRGEKRGDILLFTSTRTEKKVDIERTQRPQEQTMVQLRRTYVYMFVVSSLVCTYLRHHYQQSVSSDHVD